MNWCGAGGITGNSGDGKCEHRSEACDVWEGPGCFTYIIHLYNNYKSNKTIWSREPRAPRDWWRLRTGSQCKLFKNKSDKLGLSFFFFKLKTQTLHSIFIFYDIRLPQREPRTDHWLPFANALAVSWFFVTGWPASPLPPDPWTFQPLSPISTLSTVSSLSLDSVYVGREGLGWRVVTFCWKSEQEISMFIHPGPKFCL